MFKKMKHMKNEKGLTLIELLAVIVILAIIAAIAIPAIGNIINNSEVKAVKSDALNILSSANIFLADNPGVTKITVDAAGAATSTPTTTSSFADSLQSSGTFKGLAYTIDKASDGTLTLTASGITAGGKTIGFAAAGVEDIDAKSADADGTKVTVVKTP